MHSPVDLTEWKTFKVDHLQLTIFCHKWILTLGVQIGKLVHLYWWEQGSSFLDCYSCRISLEKILAKLLTERGITDHPQGEEIMARIAEAVNFCRQAREDHPFNMTDQEREWYRRGLSEMDGKTPPVIRDQLCQFSHPEDFLAHYEGTKDNVAKLAVTKLRAIWQERKQSGDRYQPDYPVVPPRSSDQVARNVGGATGGKTRGDNSAKPAIAGNGSSS